MDVIGHTDSCGLKHHIGFVVVVFGEDSLKVSEKKWETFDN